MHYRDVMGIVMLLLVATEVGRKFMVIEGLDEAQSVEVTSRDIHGQQFVRRMLTPPADPKTQNPVLCESTGKNCLPGEEVQCLKGYHTGCQCKHIRLCFPQASQCTVYNGTHTQSCGF